ncbi:MAG: hypothetical protein AAB545_00220 [Patescibacteria group bacterium]
MIQEFFKKYRTHSNYASLGGWEKIRFFIALFVFIGVLLTLLLLGVNVLKWIFSLIF